MRSQTGAWERGRVRGDCWATEPDVSAWRLIPEVGDAEPDASALAADAGVGGLRILALGGEHGVS